MAISPPLSEIQDSLGTKYPHDFQSILTNLVTFTITLFVVGIMLKKTAVPTNIAELMAVFSACVLPSRRWKCGEIQDGI